MRYKNWTDEEKEILKQHYYSMPWPELLALLPDRDKKKVYCMAKLMKLKRLNGTQFEKGKRRSPETEFKKGSVPFNKGKKVSEYLPQETLERILKTAFKKGNLPPNTKHDYAISQRIDKQKKPYLCIRVSLGKWEYLNRWMWKQEHGGIPKGMNVAFKDGNPLNCVPENLFLESRKENMQRNSLQRLRYAQPEIYRAIYANIQLKKTITDLNKKRNGNEKKH